MVLQEGLDAQVASCHRTRALHTQYWLFFSGGLEVRQYWRSSGSGGAPEPVPGGGGPVPLPSREVTVVRGMPWLGSVLRKVSWSGTAPFLALGAGAPWTWCFPVLLRLCR